MFKGIQNNSIYIDNLMRYFLYQLKVRNMTISKTY